MKFEEKQIENKLNIKVMKLLTDIIHKPDDFHIDHLEYAKKLQRYLSDAITEYIDLNVT